MSIDNSILLECSFCSKNDFKNERAMYHHESRKHLHDQPLECYGCKQTCNNFKNCIRHQRACQQFKDFAQQIKTQGLLTHSQTIASYIQTNGAVQFKQVSTCIPAIVHTVQPIVQQPTIINNHYYNNTTNNNCNNTTNNITNRMVDKSKKSINNTINLNLRPIKLNEVQEAIMRHIRY